MGAMSNRYQDTVRDRILDGDGFIEATFKRRAGSPLTVTIRPIELKGVIQWQFVAFDGAQTVTDNHQAKDAGTELDALFEQPLRSIAVKHAAEDLAVQFTKKGKAILHRHAPSRTRPASLAHDRRKARVLSAESSDAFLKAAGIMTRDGAIRPRLYSKYKQIDEFVRVLAETDGVDGLGEQLLEVVDLGCGSAYLTFAAYHYLRGMRGYDVTLTGVDLKGDLLSRHTALLQELGWQDDLRFVNARIIEYRPKTPPAIVLALHACDTATDEALAQAIGWQSDIILAAPCCHHHLQAQLAGQSMVDPFRPIQRHGILAEELGTLLTDAFRALILRIMGYRADVIEFVSAEHTPKNNLIRAVRTAPPGDPRFIREYNALKQFWGVTPYLETLVEI